MPSGWTHALRATVAGSALLLTCLPNSAPCHESLYNYVEVTHLENGELEIAFSVHAAELLSDTSVAPTTSDTSWYPLLTDSEKAELSECAAAFLSSAYALFSTEGESISTPGVPIPESLDIGARPGCLLGTLRFQKPPELLTIRYLEQAKRLMLVIVRPRAFPEVRDLESGESFSLVPSSE